MTNSIDWKNLGFGYIKTKGMFVANWKDGKWDEGSIVEDDFLNIHVSSTSLHYGQQCFEGMKAYRAKDGRLLLFRPRDNAQRMSQSAERILMPAIPEELFVRGVEEAVVFNEEFVPPYGTGGTLYIRPMMIGTGANLGVKAAPEYIFAVFVSPVGAYFKGGMTPIDIVTTEYDRAAPMGTGAAKVGGNYAASLYAHHLAAKEGYADCVYLDPKTHTKIEEVGAANFFAITKDGAFITPDSPSILGSITKYSLLELARHLGMEAIEGDVFIDKLDEYAEAGACGTAAVISPIGSLTHNGKKHVFFSETEVGPVTKKLYDELTGIQLGDREDPFGWVHVIK
ncbi:MAG: branched-chain amino acid aminotransferase [Tissierellia bacterium]|mgnify:CR=1 FL=1|jgi:branched-chain amino acid aminotransferase|nr:branched-chain amino acid aminotransferase [Bacillota bacterium]NLL22170.1 branched-chain amino acid aminotransferase [Tissierellia bacterium]